MHEPIRLDESALRLEVCSGDWRDVPGVVHVGVGYNPADPIIEGYGAGEIRGIFELATQAPTPIERALSILAPHLAREPLYRGV